MICLPIEETYETAIGLYYFCIEFKANNLFSFSFLYINKNRHGRRKPCILIPILGELTTAFGLMLCTYFENTPMELAGVTESLFPGLTGKNIYTEMKVSPAVKLNYIVT